MRKKKAITLMLLVIIIAIYACTQQPPPPTEPNPLKVASTPWIGWGRIKIAEEKGYFDNLEIKQVYLNTVVDVNSALLAGNVDMVWAVASDLPVLIKSDPDLRFIFASDFSGEVDAIVGRDLAENSTPNGRSFSREDVPYMIAFLGQYLRSIGLTEEDVEIIPLSAEAGVAAFTSGEVYGVATYEPFLGEALKDPDAKVLFTAAGSNVITNGLIARKEILESRRSEVLAYLRAAEKGLEFFNTKRPEANTIIAKWTNSTPQDVDSLRSRIRILSAEENRDLVFSDGDLSAASSIDDAVPILIAGGKINSTVSGAGLADGSLVAELAAAP